MYKFRHSDKKISWLVSPVKDPRWAWYWRLPALIALFQILRFPLYYLSQWPYPQPYIRCASPIETLIYTLFLWGGFWLASFLPPFEPRVTLTQTRVNRIKWSDVRRWRIVSPPGPPHLRALEVGYSPLGRPRTVYLRFDPTEVKEDTLLAFLRRVAPDKELKAEGG